jgi:polysaccharide export outer membrane protein
MSNPVGHAYVTERAEHWKNTAPTILFRSAVMRKISFYVFLLVVLLAVSRSAYAEGYVIGEEDMLQLSVWGNPELSVHLPVRPDGMISMPLVGDIKAAGSTPQELKKNLEKELVRFVKTPVVSVMITAINSFKVYIIGEGATRSQTPGGGASSGQISLRRNTTLLQLLAQLGSLGDIDMKNAYLLRAGKRLDVNFEKLIANGDVSQDVTLEPNDVIHLPAGFSSRVRVTGAVRTPGVFPYAGGMTALDAVLLAGGFTEFASQNDVIIVRQAGNAVTNIRVKLKDVMNGNTSKNALLKPGDIVSVKTGMF